MVSLGSLLVTFIAYVVIAFISVKLTTKKLAAFSAAFGIGIANVLVGFTAHFVAVDELSFYGYYPNCYTSVWYYVICYCLLLLGLSGIIMIAVDLLRGINAVAEAALGKKSDSEK